MEIRIPSEAKCETLHRWVMRHPEPHLLEIVFNVPTPTSRQLAVGRWFWRILVLAYTVFVCAVSLPRFDVAALLLAVPAVTAFFVLNQSPQVQKIVVDSKARIIRVTDLRAGKSVERAVPFFEIAEVRYEPVQYSSQFVKAAAIWIDVEPPYESVRLSCLGVLQHDQLMAWIQSMVSSSHGTKGTAPTEGSQETHPK